MTPARPVGPEVAAGLARGLGFLLLLGLGLPVVALVVTTSAAELRDVFQHPMVGEALALSLRTSLQSLVLVVLGGMPLAWTLARSERTWARVLETFVELPIVLPPAVIGVGLLMALGRQGFLGPLLERWGIGIPFTEAAVVVAQVVVSAPFFIQAATAGFRRVDDDLLLVARTLGASRARAFYAVAVPAALPALLAGAALCWTRAVGEFGATLLFAGNLAGRTQTLPLAIFSALEVDVGTARAMALLLGGVAFFTLVVLRAGPRWVGRARRRARAEA